MQEGNKKSTQGLSKWFKRDVMGLQHMVGSDFLMQIGKDQIKAGHDSQSINRQIRHGNCRLWLLPAHETPLSLKLFILSREKGGREKKEKKTLEVVFFFFSPPQLA